MYIPFSCDLITSKNVGISVNLGSLGNMRLHGSFCSEKVSKDEMHHCLVQPEKWKEFFRKKSCLKELEGGRTSGNSTSEGQNTSQISIQETMTYEEKLQVPTEFS